RAAGSPPPTQEEHHHSTELTITAIARAVGYRHGETLHRVFTRRLSTTPERYRQHFATAS
ncbi:AraC family transcriptional regulator, partial [Nocardia sp. NPDC004604]|uniref:AraC family transcriptional regulator n=1 Tax=Nocardia sp. NPDC004604 TaxID=3157013 RepID=UPI0033AC72E4